MGTATQVTVRTVDKDSIVSLASDVFDNRRRGLPRPGCDCEACFGYCLIDKDEAMRGRLELARQACQPLMNFGLAVEA